MNAIDQLEEIVESRCLVRYAADQETVREWEDNPLRKLEEQFHVNRLPGKHDQLLEAALSDWRNIENRAVSIITSRHHPSDDDDDDESLQQDVAAIFEEQFVKARNAFVHADLPYLRAVQSKVIHLQGGWAVRNIGWVFLLAVYLPQAVEPSRKSDVAFHGRRVAEVFYLELISKLLAGERMSVGLPSAIASVDAAWHLSCRWSNRGEVTIVPPLRVSEYESICERISRSLSDPSA